MRPKLLSLAGILLCVAVSALHADEASKTAKVEEFFRVSHTEQMLSQTMSMALNQTKSGVLQQMAGVHSTPEETKSLNDFQDKMSAILTNALSWEKLKPIFVKVYADAFTEEELDGLVAFYKSPAGQAMIAKTPSIMTKSNELIQQQMAPAMAEIQKLVRDTAAQGK
jgi:uncharacterized protein